MERKVYRKLSMIESLFYWKELNLHLHFGTTLTSLSRLTLIVWSLPGPVHPLLPNPPL